MFALLFIPWFKLEAPTIGDTTIPIQPFGILVAIGVLAGMRMSEWRGEKLGMRREVVSDLATHVVLIGFILGHVFDTVFYYPEKILERPWELLMIWTGLSSYGGFFGAVIGGFYWRRKRNIPLFPVLDQIAFGLPLGWFFGRMGCFVVHDHPGSVTDFFLAVDNYPYNGVVAPRHDLGLYEVLWSMVVVPLFVLLDRKPRPHGFFLMWICFLYAPVRFGLDFLREADRHWGGGLTAGHYSSIFTMGLGVWCWWLTYKRPAPKLPPALMKPPEEAVPQPA